MEYVMGIDIGTTGCKATVFDRRGQVCLQSYVEYPVTGYTGMISPTLVWDCVCQVICRCTDTYPRIAALCATSFGESVVAVEADGTRWAMPSSTPMTAPGTHGANWTAGWAPTGFMSGPAIFPTLCTP